MWGYIFASTVNDQEKASHASLAGVVEPRIEPEIIFGLAAAPTRNMDEQSLTGCLAWVAHGFEIVCSIFPRLGLSGGRCGRGIRHAQLALDRTTRDYVTRADEWARELTTCEAELFCNGASVDRGQAANVLGGPLKALRALVAVLAVDPHNPPLAAGEIVTTGSLTRAPPIAAGEVWTTRMTGIPLEGSRLALTAG